MAGPPGIDLDVSVAPCPNTWTIELEECVTSLTITPKGKLVAAATVDDKISVIDTETGELKTTLPGHAGGTNAVEFLSGVSLASCGEDGKARIWNIARSTCIAELEVDGVDADRTPDGQSITHLTVAPRGQAFAVAAGRTVIQFTIGGIAGATLTRPVRRTFPPLPSTVEALRYDAHSGNLLAAYNGGVTAWDMHRSEDSKQALDLPYDGACLCVDASPDFQWVVAGCHDASVHIFHLTPKAEGVQVEELAMSGYESKVKLVDFSPDGRWMASSGGRQNMVWNFQASPAGAVPTALGGHNRPITCQAWQPDDAGLVATCSKDGEVLLFDVEEIAHKGQPNLCLPVAGALSTDPTDEVTAFVWGLGGYFFVGHKSGILRGWHLPEEASEDDDGESEDNGSEDDAVDT